MLSSILSNRFSSGSFRSQLTAFLAFVLAFFVASGCSTGMSMNPPFGRASSNVVVTVTSTANDRPVEFFVTLASISLTDKSGNTVSLYTSNAQAGTTGSIEFMHLNGVSEPLLTVTVPQGEYAQATVMVAACSFTNVSVNATGGVVQSTYAEGLCGQGTGQTTVNLPAPIKVSGTTVALSLNLQVTQSFTLNANAFPQPTYTISPVFTLKPLTLSPQPTGEINGKFDGINARITSINSATNSFVAQTADGFPLTINSGANTLFQGVAAFSTLAVGTLVNMDVAIQPDASLVATRVEVDDLAAPMVSIGPLLAATSVPTQFVNVPTLSEGCFWKPRYHSGASKE